MRSDDMLWTSDIAGGVRLAESTVRAYNAQGQMPCNKSSAKVVQMADAEAAPAAHLADTLAPEVHAADPVANPVDAVPMHCRVR